MSRITHYVTLLFCIAAAAPIHSQESGGSENRPLPERGGFFGWLQGQLDTFGSGAVEVVEATVGGAVDLITFRALSLSEPTESAPTSSSQNSPASSGSASPQTVHSQPDTPRSDAETTTLAALVAQVPAELAATRARAGSVPALAPAESIPALTQSISASTPAALVVPAPTPAALVVPAPTPAALVVPAPTPAALVPATAAAAVQTQDPEVTTDPKAKASLSTTNKVLLVGGAVVATIITGILLKKLWDHRSKVSFRNNQAKQLSTYKVDQKIVAGLSELANDLKSADLSDTSDKVKTLKKFIEEAKVQSFTQSLQTAANQADADFKNEWIKTSANHKSFIDAWQTIRTVLAQREDLTPANAVVTQVLATLTEMSKYCDSISKACGLPTLQ